MDTKTIVVSWMDGEEQTYENVSTVVRDGVLHIHRYAKVSMLLIAEWHLPTTNIRLWEPAAQRVPRLEQIDTH